MKLSKFNISKFMRDECLRTTSVWSLKCAYEQGKTTKKELHQRMFDLYHGKADERIISNKFDFVNGQGIFKDIWEVDEDLDGAHVLISKFHRSNKILVRETDINTNVLEVKSFNSKELVNGRSLHDQAMLCLCEMKKACAFVKDHLDDAGNPKASGDSVEAIVNRLLDFMWSEQQTSKSPPLEEEPSQVQQPPSKKQKVGKDAAVSRPDASNTPIDLSADEGDADDNIIPLLHQRPVGWVFKGFMAFMFFGPFAENRDATPCRFIQLLQLTDPPKEDSKKYGRKTQREETAKAQEFERKRDANRGLTPLERVLVATEENKRATDERARIEAALMSLNARAARCLGFLKLEFEKARFTKEYTGVDRLTKEHYAMDSKIAAMEDKLLALINKESNVDTSEQSNAISENGDDDAAAVVV